MPRLINIIDLSIQLKFSSKLYIKKRERLKEINNKNNNHTWKDEKKNKKNMENINKMKKTI